MDQGKSDKVREPFGPVRCRHLDAEVSGDILYLVHTDAAGKERHVPFGIECDHKADCGKTPSDCPILESYRSRHFS